MALTGIDGYVHGARPGAPVICRTAANRRGEPWPTHCDVVYSDDDAEVTCPHCIEWIRS